MLHSERLIVAMRRGPRGMDPLDSKVFIPYRTMWKLEERPVADMEFDPEPRQVRCVNCSVMVPLAAIRDHNKCDSCDMTAGRWWNRKVCREIPFDG